MQRVVIVGAGIGGVARATALQREGVDGLARDVPSQLYSHSFAPNVRRTKPLNLADCHTTAPVRVRTEAVGR